MTGQPDDLAALIGSRLCHDLISPIGAIANGVELLRLTGAPGGPELDLIADSVAQATARLRFFRVALGAAPAGQMMAGGEVAGILSDLSQNGRVAMAWQGAAQLGRAEARLAFLLLMCVEAALPRGGRAVVTAPGPALRIEATGPRIAATGATWDALTGAAPQSAAVPGEVQFLLAPMAAAALGRTIALTATATGLVLRA